MSESHFALHSSLRLLTLSMRFPLPKDFRFVPPKLLQRRWNEWDWKTAANDRSLRFGIVDPRGTGNSGVGKSALQIQFVNGTFCDRYDPTIRDCFNKQSDLNREVFHLQIGEMIDHEVHSEFLVNDVFFVCDTFDGPNCFDELQAFFAKLLRLRGSKQLPPIIIARTKSDIDRPFAHVSVLDWCRTNDVPFVCCSGKKDINVLMMFSLAIAMYVSAYHKKRR